MIKKITDNGKPGIIAVMIAALMSLPLISCVNKAPLSNEVDETPPEVSVTVNGAQLEGGDNVNRFENMPISGIIRIHGSATDNDSGIRNVSVGTNLKLQCGLSKEIMYHGDADRPEWHPDRTYTGREVATNHATTHNFRLWYLQEKCGDDPLVKAKGDIYVTARNHFGKTTTESYKVVFTPSSWR